MDSGGQHRGGQQSLDLTSQRNTRVLDDETRLNWLQLIRSENVGPVTFRDLINRFGGARSALEVLPDLAKRGGLKRKIVICPRARAEEELNQAKKLGLGLNAIGEAGYPSWLSHVDAPPPLLYTKGQIKHLDRPIISIVGSRNGSAVGVKFTRLLATELGEAGIVVGSGLARGIDTAAHHASLQHGTIAVLAGGIDMIYPRENEALYDEIAEHGLLISERQPGLQPRGQDFPRRNRIISGMSMGVVVIEAATRSGSLITARYASEQGREVFAVPGNPLDPRAEGTNKLIRGGATLITKTADIIEAITPLLHSGSMVGENRLQPALSKSQFEEVSNDEGANINEDDGGTLNFPDEPNVSDRDQVLNALSLSPVEVDELARATGVKISELQIILLELDLAGRIIRYPGQLVALNDEA